MILRVVIHTSDWHLGKNRKYVDYLDQQRLMLSAILALVLDIISQYGDDVEIWLIIAGDIYDRNEDTDREEFTLPIVNILYPLIELKTKHKNFDFFIIDGNHDRQPYDPTDPHALVSVVSPLVKMAEHNITVHKPKWIPNKSLLLLPFNQYSANQILDLLKLYPANFLVMHECCAGISTDMGWKPPRDQDHYIDMEKLIDETALKGVFLGDIHRCQKLDPKGVAWYSGSPITLDFGEKMPKGVLIHKFKLQDLNWERDGKPELRSLIDYAPKLKFHKQLGVIDNPDNIPFEALSKHENQYLQFTVSAEVYAQVTRDMPKLFDSPQVSWDHTIEVEKESVIPTSSTEETDQVSYYKPLIEQWLKDNGKELTKKERDEALIRIIADFETRI
jgi:DNA repair exonuclease SbcCD nuclease subunit